MWAKIRNFVVMLLVGIGTGILLVLGLRSRANKELRDTAEKVKDESRELDIGSIVSDAIKTATNASQRVDKAVKEADKVIADTDEVIKKSKEVLEKNKKESDSLKAEAEKKSKRLDDILKGTLIIFVSMLVLLGGGIVHAEEQAIDIPADYETLLNRYLELADIALWYRAAYEKAEAGRTELLAQLQQQIEASEALRQQVESLKAELQSVKNDFAEKVEKLTMAIEKQQQWLNMLLEKINSSVGTDELFEIRGIVRYDVMGSSIRPYVEASVKFP